MSEHKHTPGPWDYDAGDFSLFQLETFEPLPVTEANALLQSRAPQLLEALEGLLEKYESKLRSFDCSKAAAARATIAAATGASE